MNTNHSSQPKFLILLCIGGLLASVISAHAADDLDAAFNKLVAGRVYLKEYPSLKTRNGLVDEFLQEEGKIPNRMNLLDAVALAISIRNSEPPDPESFPSHQAPRSVQAKVIAWEALESLLTGYLYAGNRDLLNAVRVAYPANVTATDRREMPKEESDLFPGTSQRQLTYARLYFLQGIKNALQFVEEDPNGRLRAGSDIYPTVPHYVTFDEEARDEILPHSRFDDPNFGGPAVDDREASQSVAYLYGSSMERLGLASVAYADQLWRSAYAGPGAGAKRPDSEKSAMLIRAADVLKQNIHSQFLAALPLAAQLDDGTAGNLNEFKQSKIDQARVTSTDALRLREQILAGEKPTQTALISAWDTNSIQQQIRRSQDAFLAAQIKWNGDSGGPPADGSVAWELQRSEEAQTQNAGREIQLRNSLETQIVEITGIDPSDYGGLRTEDLRNAYLKAVNAKFAQLIDGRDTNARGLTDGSLMSVQALKIIQAVRQIFSAQQNIDALTQKVRVELERNNEANATILFATQEIGLLDYMFQIFSGIRLLTGTFNAVEIDVGAIPRADLVLSKALREGDETISLNLINSRATIKNFLIEHAVLIGGLPAVQIQLDIAKAELNSLLAKAERLVADHIFFQGITDTLWYRDPSLAFKLEKVEDEYQSLLQEYRIELYKLARMLEAAWAERFQNPVKQFNGSTIQPLNNGSFDEFTEAESVFSVANHVRGKAFMDALKAWDIKLREPVFRGPYNATPWDANSFSGQPISLRRDIFKLIDYEYDRDQNAYIANQALNRRSIQQFRAILLDLAQRDPVNANGLSRLRIDFGLTYNQSRVILGQQGGVTVPIVQQNRPAGSFDQFWNHRVRQIGVKIDGKNVFATGTAVPVSFELYGNVDRIGFFPDSINTLSRTISTFEVPLYQRDPDKRLVGEPFFGTAIGIPAAIGTSPQVPMNPVTWPLFCDNIVLRIQSQQTLRIENIDDIQFYITMEVGSPPDIKEGTW